MAQTTAADTESEAAVQVSPADDGTPAASVWDGVYTDAQALRGKENYAGPCGKCHGYKLDGAPDDPDMFSTPPIAGAKFLRNWEGRTLAALLSYIKATMPENNPGYLSDRELVELVAYSLQMSGVPAGSEELPEDFGQLGAIVILRGN